MTDQRVKEYRLQIADLTAEIDRGAPMAADQPSVEEMLQHARSWPRDGFGEGRWFHAMADEIERLRVLVPTSDYVLVEEMDESHDRRYGKGLFATWNIVKSVS